MGQLEVVARDGFVDGEQPQHPVVVLAQGGLHLLGGPVVGRRRDVEGAAQAAVQRTRGEQHRARKRAQEGRRPLDRQGLRGQVHDIVLAAEGLDPGELFAAELEKSLR